MLSLVMIISTIIIIIYLKTTKVSRQLNDDCVFDEVVAVDTLDTDEAVGLSLSFPLLIGGHF